jgi:hypothetical protein
MKLHRTFTSVAGLALSALGAVALFPEARAASINVTNFSFETPVLAPGGLSVSVPTGWTSFQTAGGGVFDVGIERANPNQFTLNNPLGAPAEGNNFLWLNRFDGSGTAGIFQDIGAILPNTTYTLTVALGGRKDRINSPGIISLWNGTNNAGTLLGTSGGLPAQDSWQDYTVSFTTGASVNGHLTIGLSVLNASTIQADFDNVRLTAVAVVPEPSTYGLALASLLGGLICIRHRRRALNN